MTDDAKQDAFRNWSVDRNCALLIDFFRLHPQHLLRFGRYLMQETVCYTGDPENGCCAACANNVKRINFDSTFLRMFCVLRESDMTDIPLQEYSAEQLLNLYLCGLHAYLHPGPAEAEDASCWDPETAIKKIPRKVGTEYTCCIVCAVTGAGRKQSKEKILMCGGCGVSFPSIVSVLNDNQEDLIRFRPTAVKNVNC